MKKLPILGVMILGMGLAGGNAFAAGQTYSVGTNPQGSLFFGTGTAVSKLVNQKLGYLFRVQAMGGSSTIIPRLNKGKVDFSYSNALEARFAYSGTGTFKGKPNRNIRLLGVMYPLRISMAVAKNSGITQIMKAKGLRIPTQFTSQTALAFVQRAILGSWGLTDKADFNGQPVSNYIKGGNLLAQGKVDIAMIAPGSGASKKQNAQLKSRGGLRFLDVDSSPAGVARMQAVFPEAFPMTLKPHASTPGIIVATTVMAYPAYMTVGKHVSEKVVYDVTKAIYENKKALSATFGPFKRSNSKDLAMKHSTPYHPGAIKFYKEVGIWQGG